MKSSVSKVNDYVDTLFSKFAIDYLREKVHETVFVCSDGAQAKSFKQKKLSQNPLHCPFIVSSYRLNFE